MILLDTNILLWLFVGDARLPGVHKKALEDRPQNYAVSVVSLWEVATKRAVGKLEISVDLSAAIDAAGFRMLPLTAEHVQRYDQFPLLHRDPFDRMLLAQADCERMIFLTSDRTLEQYGTQLILAR